MVDDVSIRFPYSDNGPPILFTNAGIRKMLTLVKAGRNDIFYDLGCGWAQNLIVAATEFNVKKCVGIERLKPRYLKAKERVKRRSLSNRIRIVKGEFDDLLEGKLDVDIKEATIVLYALDTDKEILDKLSKGLQQGCRLVYYYIALFPEIKPDYVDYPFYVSVFPFTRPRSQLDWLRSVVLKKRSSINNKKPSEEELWDELYHDYNVDALSRNDVNKYRKRLTDFLETK